MVHIRFPLEVTVDTVLSRQRGKQILDLSSSLILCSTCFLGTGDASRLRCQIEALWHTRACLARYLARRKTPAHALHCSRKATGGWNKICGM